MQTRRFQSGRVFLLSASRRNGGAVADPDRNTPIGIELRHLGGSEGCRGPHLRTGEDFHLPEQLCEYQPAVDVTMEELQISSPEIPRPPWLGTMIATGE